jgi:hypothetical protein
MVGAIGSSHGIRKKYFPSRGGSHAAVWSGVETRPAGQRLVIEEVGLLEKQKGNSKTLRVPSVP